MPLLTWKTLRINGILAQSTPEWRLHPPLQTQFPAWTAGPSLTPPVSPVRAVCSGPDGNANGNPHQLFGAAAASWTVRVPRSDRSNCASAHGGRSPGPWCALVSRGRCNKRPHERWLKAIATHSLALLEAGGQNQGVCRPCSSRRL